MRDEKVARIAEAGHMVLSAFAKRMGTSGKGRGKMAPMPMVCYHVLGMLVKSGPMPTADIGKRIGASKPNTTFIIDRIVEKGLAKRRPDEKDRRVVKVAVTEKGRRSLKSCKRRLLRNARERLSTLSDCDLESLCSAIETIKTMLSKLEIS